MITVVAACCWGWGIGKDGKMAWFHKKDMIHFKNLTIGNRILVGRKTHEKMPKLRGREVIVLSRDPDKGVLLNSILDKDAFLIGGEKVWRYAFENGLVDKIILTQINKFYDCDARFPFEYLKGFTISDIKQIDDDAYVFTYNKKMI